MKRTLTFLDRFHWLWLAMAAPFMLFPSPTRSLAMLVVPALFLLHWFAIKRKQQVAEGETQAAIYHRSSAIPYTPLNGALLILLLMVLVSLWATFDINFSLPKISGMVLGIGVFFAVVREGERPRGWFFSLLVFIGIGLGIAILGVFGTSWISNKIPSFQKIIAHLPRLITGLQGANAGFHPNEVAGALIWLLPLMLVLSISMLFLLWRRKNIDMRSMGEHKQVKLLGWRVAGVTISCLAMTFFITAVFVLSQSRGAYLGLMTTLILLILIAWQPRLRWYSLVFLALLTIALGIGFSLHRDAVRVWISGSSINGTPGLSLYTLKDRLEVWSRAIYGIQDFPFTGMGMNTFRKVMPVLYPLFTVFLEGGDIGHAHNEFLQAALDLGIPGLIAFFALYVGSFWMLIDVWRTTRSSSIDNKNQFLVTRSLTLGLGGGLLAHLLYGLTDAVALGAKPGVLFWILLGLIVGLYQQVRDHESVGFGDNPSMEPKKDYGHD